MIFISGILLLCEDCCCHLDCY